MAEWLACFDRCTCDLVSYPFVLNESTYKNVLPSLPSWPSAGHFPQNREPSASPPRQVLCRNADSLGCVLGGFVAFALYELEPLGPFLLTGSISAFAFVVYTTSTMSGFQTHIAGMRCPVLVYI